MVIWTSCPPEVSQYSVVPYIISDLCCKISSKSVDTLLSNVANRHTFLFNQSKEKNNNKKKILGPYRDTEHT